MNIKSTIFGVLAVVAILGGVVWLARSKPMSEGSLANVAGSVKASGALTADGSTDYNFGSISMGAGNVKHIFKIKNSGSEAVAINKMYTSCMCTTATLEAGGKKFGPIGMQGHGAIPTINKMLAPNEEALVEVVFDPAAHGPAGVGRIKRVVTLENSSGQPLELTFSALVTP